MCELTLSLAGESLQEDRSALSVHTQRNPRSYRTHLIEGRCLSVCFVREQSF